MLRGSGDLDILIELTTDNAARLLKVLESFGSPLVELTPESLAAARRKIEMGVPPVQI